MKLKEIKSLTGMTYYELSKAIGIPQSRCEKLCRSVIPHKPKDFELIKQFMESRGKNVIHVKFTQKKTRVPFSWERRREIDLVEYRKIRNKRRDTERRIEGRRKLFEIIEGR